MTLNKQTEPDWANRFSCTRVEFYSCHASHGAIIFKLHLKWRELSKRVPAFPTKLINLTWSFKKKKGSGVCSTWERSAAPMPRGPAPSDRHLGFARKNRNRLCMYLSGRICRRRGASFVPSPWLQERRLFPMQTANANRRTVGAQQFPFIALLRGREVRPCQRGQPLSKPLYGVHRKKSDV